jgi:hypothetical protein
MCATIFTVDIKMLIHHTSADSVEEEWWIAWSHMQEKIFLPILF